MPQPVLGAGAAAPPVSVQTSIVETGPEEQRERKRKAGEDRARVIRVACTMVRQVLRGAARRATVAALWRWRSRVAKLRIAEESEDGRRSDAQQVLPPVFLFCSLASPCCAWCLRTVGATLKPGQPKRIVRPLCQGA